MNHVDRILQYLHFHPSSSRVQIMEETDLGLSDATVKRLIADCIAKGLIQKQGSGRTVRYSITPQAHVLMTFDLDAYFEQDIDERQVQPSFNFELINDVLPHVELFLPEEKQYLDNLQKEFTNNVSQLSPIGYAKEMERLGIDLSWKSSQIEGNTYTLLETERLLKEQQEAKGKKREEAIMLLNHKEALKFILSEPDYLHPLTVNHIEDIHTLLTQDLNVDKGIRHRRV